MAAVQVPLVTVVIPAFERTIFLGQALSSVLGQTFPDFEIIVVDDCSSRPLREQFTHLTDVRLRWLRHEKNLGASAARNTGISQARGRFISFLDDDDEWLPRFLEKMVKALQDASAEVGVVHCGVRLIDQEGRIKKDVIPRLFGDVRKHLLRGEKLGGITALVRKEVLEKVGLFDEELQSGQDWDLWIRASYFCRFELVPEVLAKVREHDVRISTDYRRLIAGRTRIVEKYRVELSADPEVLCIHLKRLAKMHALNGTWAEAWRWAGEAGRVRKVEYLKFLAWFLLEYPWRKLFTPEGKFKRSK